MQHFNPKRYLDITKTEGLEISQPTLDLNSTEERVYDSRGSVKCSGASDALPCIEFVAGMDPVCRGRSF
ncbi:hypothetical protein HanXRQr2_Chr17g0812611 [Helianthus annuus]|uniref:Uncharacterized protein n=1 Tax=Helianthus annuus TaxID=4232 RepID=A0A9K3GUJ0_HELAN|nr:hypothetical protein HanXRQr2_Chr17g0812611 [Helianthus annuus]KAJ0429795.1 hypothetical protein HanHA300_Chr17g0661521 [Helianthus annuus]